MQIQKYKQLIYLVLLSTGILVSCTSKQPEKETNAAPAEEKKEALALSPEQLKAVGIEIDPLEQHNLSAVVKANGQLAVPPQNQADVSVLYGGIIGRIYVLEGQQVKQGQVLAMVKNQDLIKLQQDYLASKNSFAYIQAEYDRQKQLNDAGAGTGKSFQSATANFNAESARLKAYESQLQQLGISPAKISSGHIVSQFPVSSPINGTVGQITANTGAFVQRGTSIMEVVDNAKIHCDLTVFEKDLMAVKIGQQVNFQLTNQNNQVITGTINGINKSFENESKGVIVHAVIHNPQHQNLIPGMYVTALINVGTQKDWAVPVSALVRTGGRAYIFVVEEHAEGQKHNDYQFKKVEVATGVSELGFTQIKPLVELPEKTKIVTKGAFYLESKIAGGGEEEE